MTCSYCLTMIPAWRAAVDAMLDLLVDDGALCLIDFTQRFDRASTLAERVYKAGSASTASTSTATRSTTSPRARRRSTTPRRGRACPTRRGTRRATCSPAARRPDEVGSRPLTHGFRYLLLFGLYAASLLRRGKSRLLVSYRPLARFPRLAPSLAPHQCVAGLVELAVISSVHCC